MNKIPCRMDQFSEKELKIAVSLSNCLEEVLVRLGFKSLGNNRQKLIEKIKLYDIDIFHFGTLQRDPNINYFPIKGSCGNPNPNKNRGQLISLGELESLCGACNACPSGHICPSQKCKEGEK